MDQRLTGEYLFDEKSIVDSLYVVLEGEIRISRLDGAEEAPLATHHPGDFTGGLTVLTGRHTYPNGQVVGDVRIFLCASGEPRLRILGRRSILTTAF